METFIKKDVVERFLFLKEETFVFLIKKFPPRIQEFIPCDYKYVLGLSNFLNLGTPIISFFDLKADWLSIKANKIFGQPDKSYNNYRCTQVSKITPKSIIDYHSSLEWTWE